MLLTSAGWGSRLVEQPSQKSVPLLSTRDTCCGCVHVWVIICWHARTICSPPISGWYTPWIAWLGVKSRLTPTVLRWITRDGDRPTGQRCILRDIMRRASEARYFLPGFPRKKKPLYNGSYEHRVSKTKWTLFCTSDMCVCVIQVCVWFNIVIGHLGRPYSTRTACLLYTSDAADE